MDHDSWDERPKVTAKRMSRRGLLQRGAALGLSLPALSWLLAACGGDDDDSGNPTATAAGPGATTTAPAAQATATSATATGEMGGTLTLIWPGTTPDLDPQSAYSYVASSAFRGTYEMLIQLKGSDTYEYVPMLAREWSASEDGSEYTFTLYDNVTFHDGTVCDANAVAASLQRFHKLGLGPVNVITRFVEKPEDITAPDAKTVKFKLITPNALFLAAMASQYGPMIISPAAVEAHKTDTDEFAHEWLVQNMVGTGPYKQKEYQPNERLVLEKFDDYYLGWDRPHFDTIVFRIVPENATRRQLLESGEADALVQSLTPADLKSIKEAGKLTVFEYDSTNVGWAWMNAGAKLKEPKLRQAFSWAWPYEDVRTGVYEGLYLPTGGPITPTTKGWDPDVFIYTTDLDKAKALFDEIGFDYSQSIEYRMSSDSENEKAVAQLFQANLQQIGVKLEIVQQEYGAFEGLIYSEAPPEERPHFFGGWGWWPDYNDAYNQLYPNFHSASWSPNGSNGGFYKNERLDEILDTMAPGVSDDEYATMMKEALNILTEQDPPAIYYGTFQWYTITQPNIKGFVSNPIYLGTYNFYDMYRET